MPSVSVPQRRLMGLALHHPEKVRPENRGVLSMSKSDLHDFASTSEKGLRRRRGKMPNLPGRKK